MLWCQWLCWWSVCTIIIRSAKITCSVDEDKIVGLRVCGYQHWIGITTKPGRRGFQQAVRRERQHCDGHPSQHSVIITLRAEWWNHHHHHHCDCSPLLFFIEKWTQQIKFMHPCLQLVWSSFKISDAQTKQLALVPLRDAIPSSSYKGACIDESGNVRIIICSWEMWGGFWEQFQGVSRGVTVMLQLAVINAVEYPTSNWLLWKHTHTIFSLKGGATQIISRCITQCHCYVNIH